jgi:hypothetical protein
LSCGQKWLARFTPFFTERERKQAGCQHRLFFSQIEYCDNLIFHRRTALDKLGDRLLDANRTIGQPDKITVIFGRKITKHYRGKLQRLATPTITPTGKRIPGLKLDHPRQIALMHALVRFAHIPAANTFSTAEIYPHVIAALAATSKPYRLSSLRYDLSKLRAKGLVEKPPRSRRYRLPAEGYSVCLIFLKLFERVYAPLAAGLLLPVPGDPTLAQSKRSNLDRLYQRVTDDLADLVRTVGLKFSSPLQREQNPR